MKRNTQLAELKTQVKHNTLHKVTARGGKGSKVVANQTKQSLRITWVKENKTLALSPRSERLRRHCLYYSQVKPHMVTSQGFSLIKILQKLKTLLKVVPSVLLSFFFLKANQVWRCWNHWPSVVSIPDSKNCLKKSMDKNNRKLKILYKCIQAN